MKKRLFIITLFISLVTILASCETPVPSDPTLNIDLSISTSDDTYYVGDSIIVDVATTESDCFNNVALVTDASDATIIKNVIIPTNPGTITVEAVVLGYEYVISNKIILEVLPSIYEEDLYQDVDKISFYEDYEEAINPRDVELRTLHGLMSGAIELPDERPLLAPYQPKEGESFVRNTNTYYSDDQKAYYITDGYGEIVDVVFENGGYISLDEVASHLLAFGKTPANYSSSKKTKPTESIWKEYLRVNNTAFSGSTSKYPYEPELPNISGCGGDLYYYEIDFGTAGTTCDPSYKAEIYNNGTSITRGAARLVYTRYDANHNDIIDPNEKYVFYTYNHYNDFQEYLNYQNGWGEIFGNVTGGGTISSKTDYNPTDYVEVVRKDFSEKINLEERTDLFVVLGPGGVVVENKKYIQLSK